MITLRTPGNPLPDDAVPDGFGDSHTSYTPLPMPGWPDGSATITAAVDTGHELDRKFYKIRIGKGASAPVCDLIRRQTRRALHRQALEGVSDHQLLSHLLVLAGAADGADEIAWRLLRQGGSIAGIVAWPVGRLQTVAGLDDARILSLRLVLEAGARIARDRVVAEADLNHPDALVAYCTIRLARDSKPAVRVLYLDASRRLMMDDEHQGRAANGPVLLHPRRILRRAVELDASAVVVARGALTRQPVLDERDRRVIAALQSGATVLGIELMDYLVVGPAGYSSWRQPQSAEPAQG